MALNRLYLTIVVAMVESSLAIVSSPSGGSCSNNMRLCVYWASQGECQKNSVWMQKNCQGACSGCAQQTFIEQCLDKNDKGMCSNWVASGECAKASGFAYMLWQCQKSCNLCGSVTVPASKQSAQPGASQQAAQPNAQPQWPQAPVTQAPTTQPTTTAQAPTAQQPAAQQPAQQQNQRPGAGAPGVGAPGATGAGGSCSNTWRRCLFWAQTGECQKNAQWMTKNCAGACSNCPTQTFTEGCRDVASQCTSWVSSGECQKNLPYMVWQCPKSCNFCTSVTIPWLG